MGRAHISRVGTRTNMSANFNFFDHETLSPKPNSEDLPIFAMEARTARALESSVRTR